MTSNSGSIASNDLPANSIQRVLFIAPRVHVFQVPPLTSTTKGHVAAQWTTRDPIFTARIRIFETAVTRAPPAQGEIVTVSILLEDASTGELFAEAPYSHPSAVQQCQDSSRFFAVRVEGPGPDGKKMKATLGIGFEERSEAFDFGVALADAGKVLGIVAQNAPPGQSPGSKGNLETSKTQEPKRDYSLKDGEKIVVNIGGKGRRVKSDESRDGSAALMPILPPPPSADDVRKEMRGEATSTSSSGAGSSKDSGFDDDFGDFQ